MFDAKSILEALLKGAAPQQQPGAPGPQGSVGGFGDILGQLTQMAQAASANQQSGTPPSTGGPAGGGFGGMGGLGDILGKLQQAAGSAMQSGAAPGTPGASGGGMGGPAGGGFGGMGGLGDILGKLQQAATGGQGGGNLMDVLNQVLGQATAGVKEGAGRVGEATGANDAITKALGGQSPVEILAKLQQMAAQNQLGAGAAAGGLGALILGTRAGRSVAIDAAKLGALALIGGLAYKAMQNYQAGKPAISVAHSLAQAAPDGSGFEPSAVTHEAAELYIKTMIAAAAADGRIDQGEVAKIVGAEQQAGLGSHAQEFLQAQAQNPATVDELAEACQSPEQAVQVYTAARLAITPDGGAEDAFLAALADKLGIDPQLAAHIDAATKSAA